jgi:hypothetical protein
MKSFKLNTEQLINVCKAEEVNKFKVGDKFVMIYRNLNAEYKTKDIFTINKIEDKTLMFTKSGERKNRYFIDDSQLITKI